MATRKSKSSQSGELTPALGNTEVAVSTGLNIFGPIKPKFLTDPKSPFADKYSIEQEEIFLDNYIVNGADEDDPLYERYIELIDRRDQFAKMQSAFKSDMGAGAMTSQAEAVGMRDLGQLIDDDDDTLEIHTREGYRMFIGRRRDPAKPDQPPIIGGKLIGAALRSLWNMTSNDNPYADWALVRYEQASADVAVRLEREITAAVVLLNTQMKRGIRLSLLKSANTAKLRLGFRSPYGFAVVALINHFDYFVRLQKTLQRKDLCSDTQARKSIHEITRLIRKVWEDTNRFDRWLSRNEVKDLSRADFIDGADESAKKRVAFVTQMFSVVPAEIFTLQIQPKHTRRNHHDTPQERALLQSVGAKLEQEAAAAASGVTAADDSVDGTDAGDADVSGAGANQAPETAAEVGAAGRVLADGAPEAGAA